jgi:hypothetical protein
VNLDLNGLGRLWLGPITDTGPGAAYYRPVALTVLSLLGRLGPWAIHLGTLLLHAGSAAMLTRLCKGARWPLLAGLVFATHPLSSEVLGWCSALPDALSVFLGLSAVLAWRRSTWLGVFLLVVGCLSKETAMLFPLMFGAIGLLGSRWWVHWLCACSVVALLRLGAGVVVGTGWASKWMMIPGALGWSLGGIVWPVPLSAVRDLWVLPPVMLAVGGCVMLGMAWAARRERLAMAGLGIVLAAPALALPVMLDGYLVAERYMYPALVGLGIWSAAVFRAPSRPVFTILPVMLAVGVHALRAPAWQSDVGLFNEAVRAHPDSSYAWHFLAISLAEDGQMHEAADAFEQAVVQGHPHPMDRSLCLQALVSAGRYSDAVRWAETGPQEDLTAQTIAWWARAAWLDGDADRAHTLLELIRMETVYDGPAWVKGMADRVNEDISRGP